MDELAEQIAELVESLRQHRQDNQDLQHVGLEMKGLELLAKLRKAGGKTEEDLNGQHPAVKEFLKARALENG